MLSRNVALFSGGGGELEIFLCKQFFLINAPLQSLFFSKSTFLQTFFLQRYLLWCQKYLSLSYFSKKINSAIANSFGHIHS